MSGSDAKWSLAEVEGRGGWRVVSTFRDSRKAADRLSSEYYYGVATHLHRGQGRPAYGAVVFHAPAIVNIDMNRAQ